MVRVTYTVQHNFLADSGNMLELWSSSG